MSAKRILDIRREGPSLFCQHLKFLAGKQGWEWTIEHHSEYAAELLQNADMVKIEMSMSADVISQTHIQPALVRSTQCLDSMVFEDGKWYPRILFHEALAEILVSSARDLDIRLPAFIIGVGPESRVVAAVFSQVGFGEIYLVGEDKALLHDEVQHLRRSHFGINFVELPVEELTIQSVSASIIINTVDLSQDKVLLEDLSYFNFMKTNGYAMDLNLLPEHNLLLEEAARADLKILQPSSLAAEITYIWLQKLLGSSPLKVEELRESWKSFLKENSSSV